MVSLKTQEIVINEFMQVEYGIMPNPKSLEIIINAGFKPFKYPAAEQFANLEVVQRIIRGDDQDTLVAKVFALSFQYEHVLGLADEKARNWAIWLGKAEYSLGRVAKQEFKDNLFNKALRHFSDAKQKGYNSKENASHIGDCYFRLRNYEEALPFFLESMQKGNDSKENASHIGDCYFRLGQFEKGISRYEKAIELAKHESFNINWMHAVDHALGDSFGLLNRARETIQSPVYDGLLQRFQALYNNFVAFGKANGLNETHFRLMLDGKGISNQRIGNAIAHV